MKMTAQGGCHNSIANQINLPLVLSNAASQTPETRAGSQRRQKANVAAGRITQRRPAARTTRWVMGKDDRRVLGEIREAVKPVRNNRKKVEMELKM